MTVIVERPQLGTNFKTRVDGVKMRPIEKLGNSRIPALLVYVSTGKNMSCEATVTLTCHHQNRSLHKAKKGFVRSQWLFPSTPKFKSVHPRVQLNVCIEFKGIPSRCWQEWDRLMARQTDGWRRSGYETHLAPGVKLRNKTSKWWDSKLWQSRIRNCYNSLIQKHKILNENYEILLLHYVKQFTQGKVTWWWVTVLTWFLTYEDVSPITFFFFHRPCIKTTVKRKRS